MIVVITPLKRRICTLQKPLIDFIFVGSTHAIIINEAIVSFQAYLDNIEAKTGNSPEDFKKLADEKGFAKKGKLNPGVKAGEIVKWLKEDFNLGHGHAMAIYAVCKGINKGTGKNFLFLFAI